MAASDSMTYYLKLGSVFNLPRRPPNRRNPILGGDKHEQIADVPALGLAALTRSDNLACFWTGRQVRSGLRGASSSPHSAVSACAVKNQWTARASRKTAFSDARN